MASHVLDKVQTYLVKEFDRMDQDYRVRVQQWNKLNRQFRGKFEEMHTKGLRARVFINATKQAVTSSVASVMEVLFPSDQFFDCVGRSSEDAEGAIKVKEVLQYYCDKAMFSSQFETYVLQAAILGTTVAMIPLIQEMVKWISVQPRIPMMPMFGMVQKLEQMMVKYPGFVTRDLYDLWVDPFALDIKDASGLFLRSFVRKASLRPPIYFGYENLRGSTTLSSIDDERKLIMNVSPQRRDDDIEIHEYHGLIPRELLMEDAPEGELEGQAYPGMEGQEPFVEVIAALANRRTLCRLELNPLMTQARPIVKSVWEDIPFEFYGRGIPENARGPQIALNTTVCMGLDEKALSIRKVVGIDSNKVEEGVDFVSNPGEIWYTNGPPKDILYPIDTSTSSINMINEASFFSSQIQEATGSTKYSQGTDSPSLNRTATGISLIVGASSRQLKSIVAGFERSGIGPALKLFKDIIIQYVPPGLIMRIAGEGGNPQDYQFKPEDIAGDFDFIPLGSLSIAAQEVHIQQLTSFLQGTANPVDSPFINRLYLLKKIYQAFGFRDLENAFQTPPQMPPGLLPNMGLPEPGQPQSTAQGAPAGPVEQLPPGAPLPEGATPLGPGGKPGSPVAAGGTPNAPPGPGNDLVAQMQEIMRRTHGTSQGKGP